MQFTISVTPRSNQLRDTMLAFLDVEYHAWPTVSSSNTESNFSRPLIGVAGRNTIGFRYGQVNGPEREYHYALLRWIALQIGRRRSLFRSPPAQLPAPAPYILFDGTEACPVLQVDKWPSLPEAFQQSTCDSFGMLIHYEAIIRELAWYHIPEGTYERVSATHQGRSIDEIESSLIEAGLDGGRRTLRLIQNQIVRLNALWESR